MGLLRTIKVGFSYLKAIILKSQLETFNKLGYQVFYIFAFDSSESKMFKLEIPGVMHKYIKKVDIIELVSQPQF